MQLGRKRKLDKYLGYILIAPLLPVTRLLGILLRRNHRTDKPPSQILFIKLLGLGSLVVASDAIMVMKNRFPDARFILLTDANIAEGIAPFGLFDEVWTTNGGSLLSTITLSFSFLRKSWTLKNLWVVDLEVYSKLTTVYSLLTIARNRFGFYLGPVFFRKYLNTHNVLFRQDAFLEDNYLAMAAAVTGCDNITIAVPPRNGRHGRNYIVLNNTCSDLALVRRLPDKTFAALCQWVLENTSYAIAITGAPKDKNGIDHFIQQDAVLAAHSTRVTNIAGTLGFEPYYQFLSDNCACMVTIDSAPLHIARKLNIPTVSVWGPTNPANYLKIHAGEEKTHLYHYLHVNCSPCVHHHEKLPCDGNNFCMKDIMAEDIIKKLQAVLQEIS